MEARGTGYRVKGIGCSKPIPLVVVLGPTSSGKSAMAIRLAKKFNGEIVSADSRQVYKGLDIGTGKVTKKEQRTVRHHLLDVAKPGSRFTVAQYKALADTAIEDIWKRGKLPFLVGGSALYAKAVVEGYGVPLVKPNWELRKELESQSLANLLKLLKKFDPKSYARIDKKNPRRVIRALEIVYETGKPIPPLSKTDSYDTLLIGIDCSREELYRRIDKRVDGRMKKGMIREVERLIEQGISKKWLTSLGLEYRHISHFLEEIRRLKVRGNRLEVKNSRIEMLKKLKFGIHDFARRQMTWYRKMPSVYWVKSRCEAELKIKSAAFGAHQ